MPPQKESRGQPARQLVRPERRSRVCRTLGTGEHLGIQADGSPTPPAAEVLARALRVLEHDGVRYGPGQAAGDELGMTYKAFDALASAGAVERINQE